MSEFPQYRKYPNDKAFFRIDSENSFEELTVLGKNYRVLRFTAGNFLDRHLISDMLDGKEGNWLVISKEEYDSKLQFCQKNYSKMKDSI